MALKLKEKFRKIKEKLMHGTGVFMFLRSVITSQISTYIDYAVSFFLFALCGLGAGISAGIGGACGGITNCAVNYRFTFRMKECSYWAIGVKFFMVWLGSMLLNAFGTALFTNILMSFESLNELGVNENLRFTIARLITGLLVSVAWNFMLQRYFVFRTTKFDNFIDRMHYYLSATRFEKRKIDGKGNRCR